MVKYNPVKKATDDMGEETSNGMAAEESSDDTTVVEMLEKYEEIKNSTDEKISETEAYEHLPQEAVVVDGRLRIPDDRDSSESDFQFLTEARKKILRAYAESPDCSNAELARRADLSQSFVSRTLSNWDWLLQDPFLFEAFVLEGRQSQDSWRLVQGDVALHVPSKAHAVKQMKQKWAESGEVFEVHGPDGELITLAEQAVEDSGTLPAELMEEPDSEEQTADSGSGSVLVELSTEELSTVLDGLYCSEECEAAEEILEQVV